MKLPIGGVALQNVAVDRQTWAEGVSQRKVAVEVRFRHATSDLASIANGVPRVVEREAEPANEMLASSEQSKLYGPAAVDETNYQARYEAK